MGQPIAIDFETFYDSKAKYGLRSMEPIDYCRHELFDPYIMSVYDGKELWVGDPRRFNWGMLHGQHLLAHNRGFDETALIEMEKRGWIPHVGYSRFTCTSQMASYVWGVDSLNDSCFEAWGERLKKEVRESADGRQWKDYNKQDKEDMLKYAGTDAIKCQELYVQFGHLWPEWEQRLADITIKQGRRGVHIDREELDRQELLTYDALKATEKVLPWRTADWYKEDIDDEEDMFGPSSLKAIAEECARNEIPNPPAKSKYPEQYEEWREKYESKCGWIRPLSSWRVLNKHRRLLQRVRDRMNDEDVMWFILRYYRAHTGRWAGAGKMNMQNQRREAIMLGQDKVAITDRIEIAKIAAYRDIHGHLPDTVLETLDFRKLITPRPGMNLYSCDLAQIEPRVLAWLVKDWELLGKVKAGMSVYEAHARTSMKWDGTQGRMKKEDLQKYQLAKARVLSLGYGAGWKKFITMALNYTGEDITANDPQTEICVDALTGEEYERDGYGAYSRMIVNDFRDTNPRITQFWRTMEEQLRASVGGDLVLTLPSGRKMRYKKVKIEAVVRPGKDGKPEKKLVISAEVQGRRKEFYGGKIVENVTQAVARDVFGVSMIEVEDAGYTGLFTAHDEDVVEHKEGSTKELEQLMGKTPEWLEGCPIEAEATKLDHYKK